MLARRSALGAALAGFALPALGQGAWPSGPVRIVAPFPPGGSVDTLARTLQQPLQAALGVPVVVDNRAGASGALGTASVARAAPDGNTFVLVFDTHAVNQALIGSIGFDTRRDLAPVMLVGTAPMLVTVSQGRRWESLGEIVAAAKRDPERITYGTIGNGSLAHLTMELVQQQAGCRFTHVPYRGGGPLSVAAASGEVDLPTATLAGLGGQVGRTLRPVAQSGPARSPSLADLPTIIEAGVAGVSARAFWGLLAPAATPPAIIERMHAALAQVLAQPETRARITGAQGIDVVGSTPADFGSFLDREIETWGRVVREKNIRPD